MKISTFKNTLLAGMIGILLTACGSSDDDVVTLTPNPAPDGNKNNPFGTGLSSKDNSKNTPSVTLDTSIQGVMASVSSSGSSGLRATNATSDINTVVIGDKSIKLDSSLRSGSKFNHISYGYLDEKSAPTTLLVQGKTSNTMPSTGKAIYHGNAVHVTSGNSNPTIRLVQASFDVDFDKKTLKGTINAAQKVNLEANISGNRFLGVSNGIATVGYFYGDKADELGGLYRNTNGTISGAYAAKK